MTTPSTITNKAMVDQTEIDGAACRIRNGELEFQPRQSGGEFQWRVDVYDTGMDGWGGVILFACSASEALEVVRGGHPNCILSSDLAVPEFDRSPIGWSVSQETAAKCWAGQILATKHIARRFSMRSAAE